MWGWFCLFLISLSTPLWADSVEREVRELKEIQEQNAKLLADSRQELTETRRELQELRGLIEETKHFFENQSEKDRKNIQDFDFRVIGLEERLLLHQNALDEILSKPPRSGQKKGAADEESEYKRALAEVNLGNYPEALKRFDEFLKKFPKSALAGNAQYWKGEALYASRDFAGALVEFQKVVDHHPKSEKVPGAVLKQGYCLFEKKSYDESRAFLNKVIQEFPKSDEAAEAKERLKKIEELAKP